MTGRSAIDQTTGSSRRSAWVLGLLALLVRLPGLEREGLWYDELQTATFAALSPLELVRTVLSLDVHPPLYYLSVHSWMWVSTGDVWIRLFSVLWSLATLGILYQAFLRLAGHRAALVVGAVFALHPLSIYYAQEARMYSMLMCAYACAWVGALGLARAPDSQRDRFLFFGGAIVAAYTHGAGFLVGVGSGAAILRLAWLRGDFRWGFISRGAALLVLAWLPWLAFNAMYRPLGAGLVEMDWPHAVSTLESLLLGRPIDGPIYWGVFLALATVGGLVAASRSTDEILAASGTAVLSSLSIAAVIAFVLGHPIFWDIRTICPITPILCVALARAVMLFPPTEHLRTVSVGALLVLVTALGLETHRLRNDVWVMRDGAALLRTEAEPGDVIRVSTQRVFWGWCWYFLGPGSVHPLATSYVETSSDGVEVRLVSGGASPTTGTRWYVYRNIDEVPLSVGEGIHQWANYGDLYVAKVEGSGPADDAVGPSP